MKWRIMNYRIKGSVTTGFIKKNNNIESQLISLEGIRIKLFAVRKAEHKSAKGNSENITFFKEKLIAEQRTNGKGEYGFNVYEGMYCLKLDTETLPSGIGVMQPEIFIQKLPNVDANFVAKEVSKIEIDDGAVKDLIFGQSIFPRPVLRDTEGNVLFANINYKFDNPDAGMEESRFVLRHKEFKDHELNVNIRSGNISKKISLNFKIPDIDTLGRIKLAYENNVIDEKTKILYYLKTIFGKEELVRGYASKIPIKSGTTTVEEIHNYIRRKDSDNGVVETAKHYIATSVPRLDREYESQGGFFKIHYTLKGENAVSSIDANGNGVPDYIEAVGAAFDNTKSITCDSRGFKTPILDRGAKCFNVYVYDMRGKYGITFPSSYYNNRKNGPRRASSYICIDNNYAKTKGFTKERDDCMKVTAAHEFFHAIQNTYNAGSDSWWKEASATWNEDEIYGGINDYFQYLDRVFSTPEKSLETSSYGGVVFAKYLSENFGGFDIIKRIWENQGNTNRSCISAIDMTIKSRYPEEDLGTVYNKFTACNYNPAQYYSEGYLWNIPVTYSNTYSAYPVMSKGEKLNHLAANYQLFNTVRTTSGRKELKICVQATDSTRWGFKVQKKKYSNNLCDTSVVTSGGEANRVEIVCKDFGSIYKEICLIPANLEKNIDGSKYSYSASIQ